MKAAGWIAALELPEGARVDQRVPKKLLLENGAPTAADKRYINEGIEEIQWVAALKPTTIGVPEYRDRLREYLEIAVLTVRLRDGAKGRRLCELIHRAVPYPVLLLAVQEDDLTLSLSHKRWSQGEGGRTVLDGDLVAAEVGASTDPTLQRPMREAMSLSRQPKATMYALYQGWMDTLLALQVVPYTGAFKVSGSVEQAEERRAALQECAALEAKIGALRAAAGKEKQIHRQVELNLELKQLQAEFVAARGKLT